MYNVQSLVKDQWLDPDSSASQLYDASTGELIGSVGHKTLPFEEMLEFGRDSGGRSLREMGFHERAKLIKAVAVYLEKNKKELYDIIAKHSGQKYDKVYEDSDRDYWMKADKALAYGMIDEILVR